MSAMNAGAVFADLPATNEAGYAIPEQVNAPGLTVSMLDDLLKSAFYDGFQQGRTSGREEGFRAGHHAGNEQAWMAVRNRLQQIIDGQLNYNVLALRRRLETTRSTITAERKFIDAEADRLAKAIRDIRDATGCQ